MFTKRLFCEQRIELAGYQKIRPVKRRPPKGFYEHLRGSCQPVVIEKILTTSDCGHIPLMLRLTVRSRSQRSSPGAVFTRAHTAGQVTAEKARARAQIRSPPCTEQHRAAVS